MLLGMTGLSRKTREQSKCQSMAKYCSLCSLEKKLGQVPLGLSVNCKSLKVLVCSIFCSFAIMVFRRVNALLRGFTVCWLFT